jgi:hypothetical protein
VSRGPLTYSLRIGERWQKKEGTAKWPGFEVYATTPWNYGLIADRSNPASSFEVVRIPGRLAPQPFTVDGSPILLRAKAKRIPQWKQEPTLFRGLRREKVALRAASDQRSAISGQLQ